jgi:hypothetical protein
MFSKPFFKFLFGFLTLVIFGVLGAAVSNRYLSNHQDMFANTKDTSGR